MVLWSELAGLVQRDSLFHELKMPLVDKEALLLGAGDVCRGVDLEIRVINERVLEVVVFVTPPWLGLLESALPPA